ncbi:MAG TPA: transcription antitermination factor NusB [Burkholderiales bacterium]|nr:transcription antitermination factor NusB [Burkholderiales bacterium]
MKGSRRRSREFCLQGLYQWLLNPSGPEELLAQLAEAEDFDKADREYFEALLRGSLRDAEALHARLQPCLDRKIEELSPVEHALLLMAACELSTQPQTPYRVVINEAVELAKSYGGTDGHKYVNGVLDRLAATLRPQEVAARHTAKSRS